MLRGDLIDSVSRKVKGKVRVNKNEIGFIVDAVFDSIKESLLKENDVKIYKFGNFEVRKRAQRKGTHPQTNEPFIIPAHKTVFLKLSESFKNELNK